MPPLQQALSKKGKRIEDPQIVAWANSKVEGSKIRSFGDPSLSTGVFLLKVRKEKRKRRHDAGWWCWYVAWAEEG